MNTLRTPKVINFGEDALGQTDYPDNALIVTTAPPALSNQWISRMGIKDYMLFDKVTPEPSIDDVHAVVSEYKDKNPSVLIGLGGGSSMDVVKYAAPRDEQAEDTDTNHLRYGRRDDHLLRAKVRRQEEAIARGPFPGGYGRGGLVLYGRNAPAYSEQLGV